VDLRQYASTIERELRAVSHDSVDDYIQERDNLAKLQVRHGIPQRLSPTLAPPHLRARPTYLALCLALALKTY
jgi:hypothetical protein